MIENINDLISLLILIAISFAGLIAFFRVFIHHRKRRLIEKEIEYYKEWY